MTRSAADARRPLRADARRNYDRLLEEARALFMEQGPDASLDEIARRAGVASGTLYRHFPTRDALVEAVLSNRVDALAELGRSLFADADPFRALAVWMRAATAHASTYGGLSASLMTAALDEQSNPVFAWHVEMHQVGEALFTRAQRAGAVRADAAADDALKLVGAIGWATRGMPTQADRLIALMLDGLRHTPGRAGLAAG